MAYTIYSVEDDENIAHLISVTLKKQGYNVFTFQDAASFEDQFSKNKPDLVLLDLMLPNKSGEEIIKEIRQDETNSDIDIIVVSAKSATLDKVESLDLGADDYIPKPFDILELSSRVNAHLRKKKKPTVISIGNVTLNLDKHNVQVNGQEIRLTNAEFNILTTLMQQADNAVSRDTILSELWGKDQAYESRTIDVHIKSLRQKLKSEGNHIATVYGYGYRYLK